MFDVCRLCLSDIPEIVNKLSYDDYTCYDTKIKLIMPEIDINTTTTFILCDHCSESLNKAYNFKCRCLEVEELINNYLEEMNLTVTNLKYVKDCSYKIDKSTSEPSLEIKEESCDNGVSSINNRLEDVNLISDQSSDEVHNETIKTNHFKAKIDTKSPIRKRAVPTKTPQRQNRGATMREHSEVLEKEGGSLLHTIESGGNKVQFIEMFDVCRLCLSDIPEIVNKLSYDDYTCYDTKIKLIMPEIDINTTTTFILCDHCSESLNKAYNFKCRCIEVEELINNYDHCSESLNKAYNFKCRCIEVEELINNYLKEMNLTVTNLKYVKDRSYKIDECTSEPSLEIKEESCDNGVSSIYNSLEDVNLISKQSSDAVHIEIIETNHFKEKIDVFETESIKNQPTDETYMCDISILSKVEIKYKFIEMFDVCRLCLSDIPEIVNKLSYDDYTCYDTKIKLIMPEIDINTTTTFILCDHCSESLNKAYNFKCRCLEIAVIKLMNLQLNLYLKSKKKEEMNLTVTNLKYVKDRSYKINESTTEPLLEIKEESYEYGVSSIYNSLEDGNLISDQSSDAAHVDIIEMNHFKEKIDVFETESIKNQSTDRSYKFNESTTEPSLEIKEGSYDNGVSSINNSLEDVNLIV
ncbi:hypothetical protein QE152_g21858 [Popillia japonica]|uniref:ZAD domain-containing protein n=1 Tax=Popillia japonica TaxID=7064 RepID=A0AAW1KNR9_POPJA